MKDVLDGFKLLREPDETIENIKNFKVVNRIVEYDIFHHKNKFYFFDVIRLYLFQIKTKKNLADKNVLENLAKRYEFKLISNF